MEENGYLVTKSAWKAVTLWSILLCWTIIPLIIMVIRIILLKSDKTRFTEDRVYCRYGVLSRHEKETAFVGISAIAVDQSFWGRIFKFGDIHVDVIGKWKVTIKGAKNPMQVKEDLSQYIVGREHVTSVMEA